MSKTIRFLGGPADQQLRAIPNEVTRVVYMELNVVMNERIEPDSPVPIVYHEYLEAFSGSSYFKYQGESGSQDGPAPGPESLALPWFTE